jgi:hypothetical protein
MNQFLRDALLDLLFQHMAAHIERGLDYDEALLLGVDEIRRQIRGTRLDLETTMINDAMREVRALHGDKLH